MRAAVFFTSVTGNYKHVSTVKWLSWHQVSFSRGLGKKRLFYLQHMLSFAKNGSHVMFVSSYKMLLPTNVPAVHWKACGVHVVITAGESHQVKLYIHN